MKLERVIEEEIENRSRAEFAQDVQLISLELFAEQAAAAYNKARTEVYNRQMEVITAVKKELGVDAEESSTFECLLSEGFYGVH